MLRRFAAYADKQFDLPRRIAALTDRRLCPQVPTAAIWRSIFGMFVLRLRSFNALEEELRRPRRWEGWVGRRRPSADTLS